MEGAREMHYVIIALLYMAAIYYASTIPGHEVGKYVPFGLPDYILHGAAFAGLAVLWFLAIHRHWKQRIWRAQWVAVAIATVYGLTDEYHQSFTGRNPSATDLLADAVGAVIAVTIAGWIAGRTNRQPT